MIKIRKAKPNDFKKISEIIKSEYGKKPYFEKWTIKNAIKTLNYYANIGKIYVATIESKIVGTIIVREEHYNEGTSLVIEELIVDSSFQGNGIGKELIAFIERYSKKRKIDSINLYASNKAKAFEFYKKIGYKHCEHMCFFSKRVKK